MKSIEKYCVVHIADGEIVADNIKIKDNAIKLAREWSRRNPTYNYQVQGYYESAYIINGKWKND